MPEFKLTTRTASYPIIVGRAQQAKLLALVRQHAASGRVFIVFDANVYALYGQAILRSLNGLPHKPDYFVLPFGESHKNEKTLAGLYDFLLGAQIARNDFVLAVGGGVTTDTVGYAASSVLRGVKWGAVPTTLLGMVDAAIGGKTGINHAHGKNLIGAIWQPSFVLCDPDYLQTLPPRELVAGYGEVVKYAGLVGEPMLSRAGKLVGGDVTSADWTAIITQSARYKAQIVAKDEREENIRAYLNLGHTFGHAIEQTLGYGKLLHGEAVIVGLLGAICLSMITDTASAKRLKDYYRLALSAVALVPKRHLAASHIARAMQLDKKREGKNLRFVLLKAPGKPYIATDVPAELVTFAIEQMIADYTDIGGTDAPRTGRQRS